MNATSGKKKEDLTDVEQQFILRLPQAMADTLRNDISSGITSLKDKFSIELHIDTRKGKVIYDGHLYHAKMVDLPCIVEALKTIDKKTLYKTADICQMLICKTGGEEEEASSEGKGGDETTKTQKERDREWHSNHGICPPFKNVRKRRFRKTLQKKVQDEPGVEKEVRRLLSMDAQAIDVKWQVVTTDQQPPDNNNKSQHPLNIGSRDIFGEVSSSSDEGEDSKRVANSNPSCSLATDAGAIQPTPSDQPNNPATASDNQSNNLVTDKNKITEFNKDFKNDSMEVD